MYGILINIASNCDSITDRVFSCLLLFSGGVCGVYHNTWTRIIETARAPFTSLKYTYKRILVVFSSLVGKDIGRGAAVLYQKHPS